MVTVSAGVATEMPAQVVARRGCGQRPEEVLHRKATSCQSALGSRVL